MGVDTSVQEEEEIQRQERIGREREARARVEAEEDEIGFYFMIYFNTRVGHFYLYMAILWTEVSSTGQP